MLFLDRGVTIRTVINGMTFDAKPTDAMAKAIRDAMLSFMSAMAEAQALTMKEAQAAGIAHARANDKNPLKYKGRKPVYNKEQVLTIVEKFENGMGVNQIAREVGLNKFSVSRITRDPTDALYKLEKWTDVENTKLADEDGIPDLAIRAVSSSRAYD